MDDVKNKTDLYDNVVVLMLENRSFDNLLGYLYEDGVPNGNEFEGLQKGTYDMPIPSRANESQYVTISPYEAVDYHQPFPDPGEEYQHINTQLFNTVDSFNIGKAAIKMTSPYNLPNTIPNIAPMNGFVNDYYNKLQGMNESLYKYPTYEQYSVIMQCFKPKQIPVLSTLAKEFAVFDHWHCSVPSQTWCNRAFWHSGTSAGFVINPTEEGEESLLQDTTNMFDWMRQMWNKPTLFTRMKDKNVSSKIYCDTKLECKIPISLTQLINGFYHTPDAVELKHFYDDIKEKKLPQYSFIEPNYLGQHNDQHPSASIKSEAQVGTVLSGEKLIYDIYMAIKTSEYYKDRTLLIITYDEHGGCFDHVSPPKSIQPEEGIQGQSEFTFERLGLRVPMVMISSYIAKNTIVNDTFEHTSFIRTMSKKWGLDYLTLRDKNAFTFNSIFSNQKREWPNIEEPKFLDDYGNVEYNSHPLNGLQKSIVNGMVSHMFKEFYMLNLEDSSWKKLTEKIKKYQIETKNIKTVGNALAFIENILNRK